MKTIILKSGYKATLLNKAEQEKLWKELDTDISVIGKNIPLYTPRDNIEYYIFSENETSFQNYEAQIKVNNKIIKVKYTLCNQNAKIYRAVRKANIKTK